MGAVRGWSMGTVEGRLKKEDLSIARSPVRTVLRPCAGKDSLIFNKNRGTTKRGMKEIRGDYLGLLVFFKREGKDGEL